MINNNGKELKLIVDKDNIQDGYKLYAVDRDINFLHSAVNELNNAFENVLVEMVDLLNSWNSLVNSSSSDIQTALKEIGVHITGKSTFKEFLDSEINNMSLASRDIYFDKMRVVKSVNVFLTEIKSLRGLAQKCANEREENDKKTELQPESTKFGFDE